MKRDTTGRLAAFFAALLKPLAALSLILLVPALSACTTAEGTNALVDPGTFEREVMDTTLQGLDILPPPSPKDDKEHRGPLVMPKQMAQLPSPTKGTPAAALPVDSDNPQINTAGLTDADMKHLRNAKVVDLHSLDGRALTDTERKQLTARLAAANVGQQPGTRALTLPPVSYFADYKGADAVCKAADGTLVPLRDARCPAQIRRALAPDMAPAQGVDQSINDDLYNAANGLTSGDSGYK